MVGSVDFPKQNNLIITAMNEFCNIYLVAIRKIDIKILNLQNYIKNIIFCSVVPYLDKFRTNYIV